MEKKHRKHAKLAQPTYDTWAKTDIGIFGSDCSIIAQFAASIADRLPLTVKYVDTDHNAFDNPTFSNQQHSSFTATYIQTERTLSIHGQAVCSAYDARKLDYQLALINSNHFEVERTILLYSSKKKASILKREHQLAACFAVVSNENDPLPNEIQNQLKEDCLFVSSDDLSPLLSAIASLSPKPPIKGLVLAGGKSTRMGQDKTMLNLHGKPQFEHLASLLDAVCEEVFISVSDDHGVETERSIITDKFVGLGPYAAILSAFQYDPNAAWLVVASDLPNVAEANLSHLISERDLSKIATAFLNHETGFPDPLCTLWEPKSHSHLLEFLALGFSCPRKVLINRDIHLIAPIEPNALLNLNTPEDLSRFISRKR